MRGVVNLIKKLDKSLREKGVICTGIKTVEYLTYLYRKTKTKPRTYTLKNGDLMLVIKDRGVDLLYKNTPLTQNVGFYSAVKNLGQWHDSTKSDWRVVSLDKNFIKLHLSYWNLPLNEVWKLNLISSREIIWALQIEIENYLALEEVKAGLSLIPSYDKVKIGKGEYSLPDLIKGKEWEKIPLNGTSEVMLYSERSALPCIRFKILAPRENVKIAALNSKLNIKGRFIEAVLDNKVEYPMGKYDLFTLKMVL